MDEPRPFVCTVAEGPLTASVRLAGELDLATVAEVEVCLRTLAGSTQHVTLDLRELDFIDSTGIALVVEMTALARQDGFAFTVVKGNRQVQQVLELCGLDGVVMYEELSSVEPSTPAPTDLAAYRVARSQRNVTVRRRRDEQPRSRLGPH